MSDQTNRLSEAELDHITDYTNGGNAPQCLMSVDLHRLLATARDYARLEKVLAGEESDKDSVMGCALYAAGSFPTIHREHVQNLLARMSRFKAERDKLAEALREMLPRYIELFEHAGLGNHNESVAVQIARAALERRDKEADHDQA